LDTLTEFWKLALMLKREERRGWRKRIQPDRIESVADHSFAVAIMAMIEADQRGLRIDKTLTLALLHDLEEAITGDLTPSRKRRAGSEWVRKKRNHAITTILSRLPRDKQPYYRKLWTDLKTNRTPEAKLVHQLDKLEMALQASQYAKKGGVKGLSDFYATARMAITDKRLGRLVKELEEQH
jgi:putative hydrolase of HD superfamily